MGTATAEAHTNPGGVARPARHGAAAGAGEDRAARRRDRPQERIPWDVRELLAEHDVLGLPFSEEFGGTGTGTLVLQLAVEEIAKACASSALILMIQELGTLPIELFGSDELKHAFCRCASGEWSPAFALSEPEAGSDPA